MYKILALPAYKRLHELFEIIPITESEFGIQSGLIWKVTKAGRRKGAVAGSPVPNSKHPDRIDWMVQVEGRKYLVSRVLFFMSQGFDPGELTIDHKDRNSLNNNISNLRLANRVQQQHNRGRQSNNTSGATGVYWNKQTKKWKATLVYDNRSQHLGYYTCLIEAANAYNDKLVEPGLSEFGKPLNDIGTLSCHCAKHCQTFVVLLR